MANNFDLQEQEQLEELKHFWNKWGTPITWALVVIMGSFAAWNGYRLWQGRQAQQATALVEAVELAAQTGDMARVDDGDSHGIENTGDTPLVLLGLILFSNNKAS